MDWIGLVWTGLVWIGLVWIGLVWTGLVWYGITCLSMLGHARAGGGRGFPVVTAAGSPARMAAALICFLLFFLGAGGVMIVFVHDAHGIEPAPV